MPLVRCPHCEKPLTVRDELLGQSLRCPHCRGLFTLSRPAPVASPASPKPVQSPPAAPACQPDRQRPVLAPPTPAASPAPATVTLTVSKGSLAGQTFTFDNRATCLVGRSKDCRIRLPGPDDRRKVSRHHCLLDINPPDIRVRDFGSRNGTFVNGTKIGQRPKGSRAEEADRASFPQHDLKDGDEIRVGSTTLRVAVFVPPTCAVCGVDIPREAEEAARQPDGSFRCPSCRQLTTPDLPWALPVAARKCTRCGKDVSAEAGEGRAGEYVCASCKADPDRVLRDLLQLAVSPGEHDLLAIQGFEILDHLGRGGMGAVYLARHESSGQQVALKVMLPQVALNERTKRRFLNEMHVHQRLSHPNVVRLLHCGSSRGVFFLTMEYCDGGSVTDLLTERNTPLPVGEAARITLQVLDGLAYAHGVRIQTWLADGSLGQARGLVHRDIKPQNIFLAGQGPNTVAKVGDYGLAKAFDLAGLSGLSATGMVAGTPCFMPRQQVVDFRYSRPEVDVWATAASLYYMLTRQYPRDFPSGKDPWQVVLQDEPVPILHRNANLPRRLAAVIDQALVEKPRIGFSTAGAFKAALLQVL